jgi:hypothetical protein
MDLEELELKAMDWINMAQVRDAPGYIKCWKFLH